MEIAREERLADQHRCKTTPAGKKHFLTLTQLEAIIELHPLHRVCKTTNHEGFDNEASPKGLVRGFFCGLIYSGGGVNAIAAVPGGNSYTKIADQ